MWGVHLSTGGGTEAKVVEPAHDDWTVEEPSESAGFYGVVVKPLQAAVVGRESPPTAFAVSVYRPPINEPPFVQTELRGQVVVPLTFAWSEYVDQLLP